MAAGVPNTLMQNFEASSAANRASAAASASAAAASAAAAAAVAAAGSGDLDRGRASSNASTGGVLDDAGGRGAAMATVREPPFLSVGALVGWGV